MDPGDRATPFPSFLPRMFALGEEPMGVRVTPYHKSSCISKILNALDKDEVEAWTNLNLR
ncbi:hypothetical protein Bca4012_025208 [Brassica carinata]